MRYALLRSQPNAPAAFARLDGARAHTLDRAPWAAGRESGHIQAWTEADLLCPVAPSKIVCVGRNYAAHAREHGSDVPTEPLIFFKPPSALAGPGSAVILPPESHHVDHESELAVVIGRTCRKVSRDDALDYVFGYTCANDVSARDIQWKDGQWARAKGFDTFCPVGPWIETDLDPGAVRVRCLVNGQTRQDASTEDMVFSVPVLVSFISHMMTLVAGDLILTGTPEGVGPMVSGDEVVVEVSGVGALKVSVTK
jgi:2-keto-4-pentenoate hydratase/2-oxohepta-3-ene-1,7-dioic acid hydratase in catechol pathway